MTTPYFACYYGKHLPRESDAKHANPAHVVTQVLPTVPLSDVQIRRFKPKDERYEVPDGGGLWLRVGTTGTKTWFSFVRDGGRLRRVKLGRYPAVGLSEARTAHGRIQERARGGLAVVDEPTLTLTEFWSIYSDRHLVHLADTTQRAYRSAWDELARLHGRRLDRIARSDVARLHGELGQRSKALADKTRAVLSSMLSLAAEWGYLEAPPRFPRPFGTERRNRWLSRDEISQLLAVLRMTDEDEVTAKSAALEAAEVAGLDTKWTWVTQDSRDYFRLLLFTGARRNEVASMRWDQLHLDRGLWMRRQKGGAVTPTALPSRVVEILKRRLEERQVEVVDGEEQPIAWVFPGPGKSGHLVEPKKMWSTVCARAGLSNVRIHDLRHTHASWLAQAGVSLQIIGAQLGHRQTSTTERYAHLHQDPIRRAVEAVVANMEGEG